MAQTSLFDTIILERDYSSISDLHGIPFALSIKQPWAWLVVNGFKDVENRSWPTSHRGFFFVHASGRADGFAFEWIKTAFPSVFKEMPRRGSPEYLLGSVIGIANIYDCKPFALKTSVWHIGRFGFYLSHTRPITPFRMKGSLGFFRPDFSQVKDTGGYQL
jgi:hypothetical protein